MFVNDRLSKRRLWFLIRNDLVSESGRLILFAAIVAAVMLGASLLAGSSSFPDSWFYRRQFIFWLFVLGIPFTARVLRPFHDRALKEADLVLPASTLEKVVARLLVTTVIFLLFLLAFVTLVSLVIESLNMFLFFGERRPFFDPLEQTVWTWIGIYIVVQSFYFAGAAWFRRSPGLKTTLAIVLLFLALSNPIVRVGNTAQSCLRRSPRR